MDRLLLVIIGIFIGIIMTICIVGKAMYDAMKELKDENKK